jgi:hypothetical protein
MEAQMKKIDKIETICQFAYAYIFIGGIISAMVNAIVWEEYNINVAVIVLAISIYLLLIAMAVFAIGLSYLWKNGGN